MENSEEMKQLINDYNSVMEEAQEDSESSAAACYTPKTISEMWPVFLEWVAAYAGDKNIAAHASYSREDMRYAFQAGYELGKKEGA